MPRVGRGRIHAHPKPGSTNTSLSLQLPPACSTTTVGGWKVVKERWLSDFTSAISDLSFCTIGTWQEKCLTLALEVYSGRIIIQPIFWDGWRVSLISTWNLLAVYWTMIPITLSIQRGLLYNMKFRCGPSSSTPEHLVSRSCRKWHNLNESPLSLLCSTLVWLMWMINFS